MELMTKEIEEKFKQQGDTSSKEAKDVKVIVKFFLPEGRWTWFATEYNPEDRIFFGYVRSGIDENFDELGSFSLDELKEIRGPMLRLPVERDLHFGFNHTLEEVMKK